MKIFSNILVLAMALLILSCNSDERDRNYQYMPNMYTPVGYEAYGEGDIFENGQEAKLPVEGTVIRGWLPYEYGDSLAGYQAAKAELKNPLDYTKENLSEGAELYTIYCAICHGDKGDGQGWLVQQEKILGVPAYDDQGRAITEGSVYHVMYHGINTMGSYASQTSEEELWQISHYVMKLKGALEGKEPRVELDSVPPIVQDVQYGTVTNILNDEQPAGGALEQDQTEQTANKTEE